MVTRYFSFSVRIDTFLDHSDGPLQAFSLMSLRLVLDAFVSFTN